MPRALNIPPGIHKLCPRLTKSQAHEKEITLLSSKLQIHSIPGQK